MEQLLTVLVQTSPIPSHPSLALLEALFRSFQKADGLLECKIVILCDGVEEMVAGETENNKHGKASRETVARYREHLQLLRVAVETRAPPFLPQGNGSIGLMELSERHGSAPAIAAAFTVVSTPLVMICQHDNFFIQPVPLRQCARAMYQTLGLGIGLKCLHFMSTATLNYKEKIRKRYGLEIQEHIVDINSSTEDDTNEPSPATLTLIPLIFWYGRTHLSYTEHYTSNILNRPLKVGDHLEELLGVAELEDIKCRGMENAHGDYGTFVLDQGCGEVIYHLSGRRARATAAPVTVVDNSDEKEVKDAVQEQRQHPHPQTTISTPTTEPTTQKVVASTLEQPANGGSFTTARSCRAIVPGLEIISEARSSNPKGKFKQKCFHCGEKGHSYKRCPKIEDQPHTETIDLS